MIKWVVIAVPPRSTSQSGTFLPPPNFPLHLSCSSSIITPGATMYECAICCDEFYHQDDCDEHMDAHNHWAKCDTCPRVFRTMRAAEQHMESLGHFKNYCKSCDRRFKNENNLRMVRASRKPSLTNNEPQSKPFSST